MSKDSSKMDKTDEEKIILEFNAFVQKSFLERGLDVGSEKKVVLSNKAIYVGDDFKLSLKEINRFEFLKSWNNNDVRIDYRAAHSKDLGTLKVGGVFFDPNIETLFDKLKELIPDCEHAIKRDHFGEIKNILAYAIVFFSTVVVIGKIKEPISKVPPILLLFFLTVLMFSNTIPQKILKSELMKRRILLIIGYLFIFSIIVYIILLFLLYLR